MILVIDGNSILNRAFYGIKQLTTRDGRFTNAVYGFAAILDSIKNELAPTGIAVAFDVSKKTFRHEFYPEYKAGRRPMPPELAQQLQPTKDLLRALGCLVVECPNYEADDILGTYARVCAEQDADCVLATGDRDSLQLVGGRVTVRLARTNMGKAESVLYDEAKIKEEYGVEPAALIDVKALAGDSSDNIPGVAGVGPKTACALIAEFGTLDGVYENLASPDIKENLRARLAAGRESAYLSRRVGTIDRCAPITVDLEALAAMQPDNAELKRQLVDLEFFKFIEKWNLGAYTAAPSAPAAKPAERAPLAEGAPEELLAAAQSGARLYIQPDFANDTALASCGGKYLESGLEVFSRALGDEKIKKAVYDTKYVYKTLLKRRVTLGGDCFDPLLAAYLTDPLASGYSPERLAARCGCEGGLTPAENAANFEKLCDSLEKENEDIGSGPLLRDIEQPLAYTLADMELEGFRVDAAGLAAFGAELSLRIAALASEIYELAGGEFNLNSPKQLGEVLFSPERLALPPSRKTKSGYSTDAETLENLAAEHPIVEKLLEYRKLAKLQSTYCEGLAKQIGPDGRIHTTFIQTETRTGRISSVEPNLQNIPVRTELGSRLRDFFIADDGCVLVDADYSQIELRVLAALSGDEKMQAAFDEGVDIHARTAAEVFGLPQEMVTPSLRSRAKAVNFGIVYGIGAFSLAKDVGVSLREADEYIKNYLAAYPKVRAFLEKTVEDASAQGYVTTAFGRRRPLPELSSSNANLRRFGERAAKNTRIQGTSADIIKIAMNRVRAELAKAGLSARLILQVHDELIVSAPEAEAAAASEILRREMEAAGGGIKLRADLHVGKTWLSAKG